jgi:hypothetical protein
LYGGTNVEKCCVNGDRNCRRSHCHSGHRLFGSGHFAGGWRDIRCEHFCRRIVEHVRHEVGHRRGRGGDSVRDIHDADGIWAVVVVDDERGDHERPVIQCDRGKFGWDWAHVYDDPGCSQRDADANSNANSNAACCAHLPIGHWRFNGGRTWSI